MIDDATVRRVSVVVPAFDAERFVAHTLDGLLAQTIPLHEIVVVDDGSTDETAAVVERYADRGVRLVRKVNGGDASAINRGVASVTGDVVGICDADDLWSDRFVECLFPAFADPSVGFVFGAVQNVRDAPDLRDASPLGERRLGPLRGATLIRRAALDEVGPWDERLRSQSALDWWSRAMASRWSAVAVDELVMFRRVHDRNLNFTRRDDRDREIPQMLRAHLARRRAQEGGPR